MITSQAAKEQFNIIVTVRFRDSKKNLLTAVSNNYNLNFFYHSMTGLSLKVLSESLTTMLLSLAAYE
jgi:hypothetical protein